MSLYTVTKPAHAPTPHPKSRGTANIHNIIHKALGSKPPPPPRDQLTAPHPTY